MMRTRLAVAALSAFALLAGHEVAYRAAAWPSSPSRLLHATGHGWWGVAAPLAAGALILLLLLAVSARTVGSYRLVPRLATVLFLAVEVLERFLHAGHLTLGMSWGPVLPGAVVVYLIAAAASRLMRRTEMFFLLPPLPLQSPETPLPAASFEQVSLSSFSLGPHGARAPPVLLR